ncbi:MAG: RNA pseudouridine synthase [Crocinitomicaceae bacterium]|nr:RNA pseudouridine synthase [Crocinitomicaceae bacterium]|tara:strand:+ start:6530 stop:7213 length:684 start_codon:yes stop_codon:yes gene_type:complete
MSVPEIIFEDNHLLVVNKRSSDIVQGDKTGDVPLVDILKKYIKDKYNKPGNVFLGIPHRLDRPTSGIIMFAKTSKALVRLNKMFRNREVQKTYWAVVKNAPPQKRGTLINHLVKIERTNKSIAVTGEIEGSKYSELNYEVIAKSEHYYLLEILPKTGRHHQIRVQLSKVKCPIKGDIKYGFKRANDNASIHLHARQLTFIHPVTKLEMVLVAKTPNDPLWNYFSEKV